MPVFRIRKLQIPFKHAHSTQIVNNIVLIQKSGLIGSLKDYCCTK